MELIIISGRSGSGKSVALRVVEDLGYYCVDNIPLNLLPSLVRSVQTSHHGHFRFYYQFLEPRRRRRRRSILRHRHRRLPRRL